MIIIQILLICFIEEISRIYAKLLITFLSKRIKTLKAGLRTNIFYLIKKAGKFLQSYSYMKGDEVMSKDKEKFLICFNANEDDLVSGARYVLEKQRLIKSHKPCKG